MVGVWRSSSFSTDWECIPCRHTSSGRRVDRQALSTPSAIGSRLDGLKWGPCLTCSLRIRGLLVPSIVLRDTHVIVLAVQGGAVGCKRPIALGRAVVASNLYKHWCLVGLPPHRDIIGSSPSIFYGWGEWRFARSGLVGNVAPRSVCVVQLCRRRS